MDTPRPNLSIVSSNCDCEKCPHEHICCSADVWQIHLNPEEVKRLTHVRLPNGQYILPSGTDGYCVHFDHKEKKCSIYDERPSVCKRFSCEKAEERMTKLLDRHKEIRKDLDARFSGYLCAFVFDTLRHKNAGPMVIRDSDTGQEFQVNPTQFFGDSEEEIRNKMAEFLSKPFGKVND